MNIGWYSQYPFTYNKNILGVATLTGLDIELSKAIARKANYSPVFIEKSWNNQLESLKTGKIDVMLSGIKNDERKKKFRISNPIRKEHTVIYIRNDSPLKELKFKEATKFLNWLKENKYKVGITKGNIYTNNEINNFISNKLNSGYIEHASCDYVNLRNLINRKVEAVFIDNTAGASISAKNEWDSKLTRLNKLSFVPEAVCYMLSRKTSSENDLLRLNKAISDLKGSGEYQKILKTYLTPVILNLTVNSKWYFYIILAGTIAYCICALILVVPTRQSLIGSLIFVTTYAVGGGVLRGIITGKYPLFIFKEPVYIYTVLIIVLFAFIFINLYRYVLYRLEEKEKIFILITSSIYNFYLKYIHDIIDSIGLAAFIVFGVIAALEINAEPLILWGPVLAMITTSGGGVICNMLQTKKFDKTMKNMYTEISAIWGGILSFMLSNLTEENITQRILFAVTFTVIGAFFTRWIVCYFKIPSIHFLFTRKK